MRDSLDLLLETQLREVGGISVRRTIPRRHRRMVGPFIFFDHMGPADFDLGEGIDVDPHPHIGLSTVTYLFQGRLWHRDSIGSSAIIEPGAINWMHAGAGVAHSERSPDRTQPDTLHGLQLWVASPTEHEQGAPSFSHHSAASRPAIQCGDAEGRLLVGDAFGVDAGVPTLSPLFYLELHAKAGQEIVLPHAPYERAFYLLDGQVSLDHHTITSNQMAILTPQSAPRIRALRDTHLVAIGGEPIGNRLIFWNFVSSDPEQIREAAHAWRARSFPAVTGDDGYTPLDSLPPANFR